MRLLPAIIGILFGIGAIGSGKAPSMPATTRPSFAALDDKAASIAADEIVANYRALEQELTAQLDSDKTPPRRKVLLVYALGQLRSRWAVASLVNIVDFRAPFIDPKIDVARWGEYPAVDALTAIGDAAVVRIVEVLPNEKDPARVRLMLTVIWQVEGSAPGRAWLEDALAAAQGDAAKQNLRNALTAFQKLASELEK